MNLILKCFNLVSITTTTIAITSGITRDYWPIFSQTKQIFIIIIKKIYCFDNNNNKKGAVINCVWSWGAFQFAPLFPNRNRYQKTQVLELTVCLKVLFSMYIVVRFYCSNNDSCLIKSNNKSENNCCIEDGNWIDASSSKPKFRQTDLMVMTNKMTTIYYAKH